jgi:hypothetical protein
MFVYQANKIVHAHKKRNGIVFEKKTTEMNIECFVYLKSGFQLTKYKIFGENLENKAVFEL